MELFKCIFQKEILDIKKLFEHVCNKQKNQVSNDTMLYDQPLTWKS